MARTPLLTGPSSREVPMVPVSKPSAQPVFDATKAALKQSLEGPARVDPFSLAMREAYDNDWSEAANRSALGLVDPVVRGVAEQPGKSSVTPRESTFALAPGQETYDEPGQKAEAGSVTSIGKLSKADAIEPATTRAAKTTGLTRHELLMRLSVTMSREQTLTFGSEEPARKVLARRSHFLWARDPLRAHKLRLAEMYAALRA